MESIHIVNRPVITEKSSYASSEHNRFTFLVSRTASKDEIKRAIQDLYKVRVVGVATKNHKGRERRLRYGYVPGKTTKHAIVKIHPDDTLELF